MGNTISTPRDERGTRDQRRFQLIHPSNDRSSSPIHGNGRSSRLSRRRTPASHPLPEPIRGNIYGTFRRQISAQSVTIQPNSEPTVESDEILYEQEERPLVNMGELGLRDGPITHIAAEPLIRRRSTMSRLGSRLLPDTVMRGLLNSGEETPAEGRALRQGFSGRTNSTTWVPETEPDNSRFSLRQTLRPRPLQRPEPRRQTIRGPFPLGMANVQILGDESTDALGLPTSYNTEMEDVEDVREPRRRARFSGIRNSVTLPLLNMFGLQDRSQSRDTSRAPPMRPSRVTFADDSTQLLPPLTGMDHRLDLDDGAHELDAVEPETRNVLSTSRITSGISTIRRFPHGLRSRSTRLIRRGEHPPLSQVLQLAAAAIAAQLSGHAIPSSNGVRPLGGDTFDGSIQNFVQTLQDAASAQAGENIDLNAAEGDLPPVNFMRVFQFPNDENGAPITSQGQSRNVDDMDFDHIANNGEGDRSVTLVLVGVRSMPHGHEVDGGDNDNIGPSLDTLLSLPFLPPTNVLRNGSSGALFRRSNGRTGTASRRHSMTNFNFPAQYETQRHSRTRSTANRSSAEASVTSSTTNVPMPSVLSESPPGPHPPPSTPADVRSGTATPARRPSSASAVHAPPLLEHEEAIDPAPLPARTDSAFNIARQRRRSDSEFARRPELSSGAARRNGVVEPDRPAPGTGRSWLIYVVGTNVSSDHPAFTMPSLFTDNPSYEDMQMLSNLLGPVKPPVATQEDVASAGGVYRIVLRDTDVIAESITPEVPSIAITNGDRCLICLCDYEAAEEVRQLDQCRHLYHRECIDEWLTGSRNSCPMCRGQGVNEKADNARTETAQTPETMTG